MKKYNVFFGTLFIIFAISAAIHAEEVEYLNKQVLAFAHENMGKKIGRGECWDLAAQPLKALGATWNNKFIFGKKIGTGGASGLKLERDMTLMPGDIIHFLKVKTSWTKNYPDGRRASGSETIGMPDHVAILKKYDGKTLLTLLHQNVSGKRYMVETTTDIANVKSGVYIIYRPFREKK
jgi:hypothetical protein